MRIDNIAMYVKNNLLTCQIYNLRKLSKKLDTEPEVISKAIKMAGLKHDIFEKDGRLLLLLFSESSNVPKKAPKLNANGIVLHDVTHYVYNSENVA